MPHSPKVIVVPYHADSRVYFLALQDLPYPVWLDSCQPASERGRYDIIAAEPTTLLTTRAGESLIQDLTGREPDRRSHQDPFTLINELMPPVCQSAQLDAERLPFCGGAIGFFGYDLARQLERLPSLAKADLSLPDLHIGLYPWALVIDHETQTSAIVALPGADTRLAESRLNAETHLKSFLEKDAEPFKINRFDSNINIDSYIEKFDTIQEHILEGDCYQVNFAQRFSANFSGDPLAAYLSLRLASPAPFAGFIPLENGAIASVSPERFIDCDDGLASTSPIKGTAPRDPDPSQDKRNARALENSEKDRAENLMIVDLLRNDLSRCCEQVNVPTLFELQSFANVHHLVSTIEGRLKPGETPLSLLRAAFPGGSITGAPKIKAMEIIESLESHKRGPYCGSLGYISACGRMDTSIAIRTLVFDNGRVHCWGGGGIVADSTAEAEYQESLTKVTLLMRTLEAAFGSDEATADQQ